MNQHRPPILLLGMHRSGTSLLARCLQELGLFIGWRLDENHESTFFQRCNKWLLANAGGRWDTPRCIRYLLEDGPATRRATEILRRRCDSLESLEYSGPSSWLKGRLKGSSAYAGPWGWKDPRTTVTLPLWHRLFPDARCVVMVRNGVDVAASLKRRSLESFPEEPRSIHRLPLRPDLRRVHALGESVRARSLAGGFDVWNEYMDLAAEHLASFREDRVLTLRYEDLLREPIAHLDRVQTFCELSADRGRIQVASGVVRSDRGGRFSDDPALRELWLEVKDSKWMKTYGYDSGPRPPAAHASTPSLTT
jgi:hypothetical protein